MNTKYQVGELRAQQAEERTRNTIIISVIVFLALTIFIFFRIRSARRLKQAHEKLEDAHEKLEDAHEKLEDAHSKLLTAYDQLEETTIAKERIESDLRIARDIQMGMVPHTFPQREDIDLYASMTPAKEVGGDLYDYLLIGNYLYFCLGDVSGKGVPASLFMAMARNMFHVLAQQELQPADIATRLNNTLSEDNETSMFVTMFIGKVDLRNGHLDFCNGGHNPPVLIHDIHAAGGEGTEASCEFLEMIPNAPIGLWPGLEYEGEEIADISGKPLFVYTDGLNEAENCQHD
ncbi:MAG: SpoIIE family protein phosphatase, partial [Bacteroidaceae bacterium]|nr:SpoIIE family protein phosphatase [Bacteroidaceae bacterium]